MLDYIKTILKKVSFDSGLFEKELLNITYDALGLYCAIQCFYIQVLNEDDKKSPFTLNRNSLSEKLGEIFIENKEEDEVVDILGFAPDIHVMPVGNAGNITAYWKGYKEYKKAFMSRSLPMMWGFQAAGAAPIVKNKIVKNPETIATAIRIGNPASWDQAVAAQVGSKGLIDSVTDKEILSAYRLVAAKEGVFVEPSSAAGIAGLIKKKEQKKLPKGATIVVTVTGNGLKDVQWILNSGGKPTVIPVNMKKAAKVIGLK